MTTHVDPHPHQPPMVSSEEADRAQLELAREQGDAYGRALDLMVDRVAVDGGSTRVGDYIVAWAVEHAEGMYDLRDGQLDWGLPPDANCHLEIAVRDAADGRFVPGLRVTATLVGPSGQEVGTHDQPFLWHPWLYHYGRNWAVPGDGTDALRVRIDPPTFPRHDPDNGHRYAEPVTVTFEGVTIETGRK